MQRARLCPRAPVLFLLTLLLVVATHMYRTSAGEDTPEVSIHCVINGHIWEVKELVSFGQIPWQMMAST